VILAYKRIEREQSLQYRAGRKHRAHVDFVVMVLCEFLVEELEGMLHQEVLARKVVDEQLTA